MANTIMIQKQVGKERLNCRYVESVSDIPACLLDSGAVSVNGTAVTMVAVEGPATREFPFYMSWESTDKLESGFGVWPKDNGATTLIHGEDGKLYDKAPRLVALVLNWPTEELPEPFGSDPNVEYNLEWNYVRVQTSWGETRELPIDDRAVLIQYGEGDVNLLSRDEDSAKEYNVVDEDGNVICPLVEY